MKVLNDMMEMTEELLKDYLSNIESNISLEMRSGMLGQRALYRTNLSRQMTLDDYMGDGEDHSFLVFNVVVNPRAFKEMSPHQLAISLRHEYLKKV